MGLSLEFPETICYNFNITDRLLKACLRRVTSPALGRRRRELSETDSKQGGIYYGQQETDKT